MRCASITTSATFVVLNNSHVIFGEISFFTFLLFIFSFQFSRIPLFPKCFFSFFTSLSLPFSLAHVAGSCAYQPIPWPSTRHTAGFSRGPFLGPNFPDCHF